jgi:hypothetical protein
MSNSELDRHIQNLIWLLATGLIILFTSLFFLLILIIPVYSYDTKKYYKLYKLLIYELL